MAIGPVKFAGIIGGRTIAPTVYVNPLGESSLASWIANPTNDYTTTSILIAILMGASAVWLIRGAVMFAKTETLTFGLAVVVFSALTLLLIEGGKYDPWALDQTTFAGMLFLAGLSSAGRLFAQRDDKEGAEKDRKK